jgi:ABC-type transport system involved in multi-copper enzyme maturation permease subunit
MKEFHSHLLTEKFVWTTLLCLGMVLMSFWLMINDYQTRLANYSISLQKDDNLYGTKPGAGNSLFCYFLEPHHQTSRSVYIRPTSIVKEPNVMSIFVQGLEKRMSRPACYSIFQEVDLDDVPYTNFLLDIYAKPDLMYIVQIVMSLLALLFVFQSVCGERENGTLRLMLSNAVPRDAILLGKWIGGFLGLMLPFLLATGVGLLALLSIPSVHLDADHWIRLAWLLLASLLYISTFLTLGILISTLTRQTTTAFLAALFVWVILVLVIPNTGALLARQIKPIESAQQLQVQKDLTKRQMEDERDEVQYSSYWIPTYGKIHIEIWDDIREAISKLDSAHSRRIQELTDYMRILTRPSPAAAYAYAAIDIAGTDLSDELAYYDQLRRYIHDQPQKGNEYVRNTLFTHQKWDFHYTPKPWRNGVSHALVDLLILALLNVVLFLCAYLAFIRYQVT